MVKLLALATLSVYLSCVAATASSPGEPTRQLRSAVAADAQAHHSAHWAKIGKPSSMEGKYRITESTSAPRSMEAHAKAMEAHAKAMNSPHMAMEARTKAMNAPHKAMPNVVMEARGKKPAMEARGSPINNSLSQAKAASTKKSAVVMEAHH